MTDREKLTDEERERILESTPLAFPGAHYIGKMIRIIDAHEADRAALVQERDEVRKTLALVPTQFVYNGCFREAPDWFLKLRQAIDSGSVDDHLEYHRAEHPHALEEALRRCTDLESRCASLSQDRLEARAEVARLTQERDEAQDDVRAAHQAHANAVNAKQAEVTRLSEALAAAEHAIHESNRVSENAIRSRDAAEAQVTRLTEALAAWKQNCASTCAVSMARAEAAEEKLAAAERKSDGRHTANLALCASLKASGDARMAAEARVRELEADLDSFRKTCERLEQAENTEISELRARVAALETAGGRV